jgi:hypothetical protein
VTFSTTSATVPSFNTFTSFENWSQDTEPWQSTGGILDMPLDDVGTGVGMSIDSLSYSVDPIAGRGGSGGRGTSDMRMDIDGTGIDSIFTEADFDFWDDGKAQQSGLSSAPTAVPPPLGINSGTSLTQTAGPTPLGIPAQLFEDAKSPAIIPSAHAPMWPPSALAGAFPSRVAWQCSIPLLNRSLPRRRKHYPLLLASRHLTI